MDQTTGVLWENGDKIKKFLQQQVVDQTRNWTKVISGQVAKSSLVFVEESPKSLPLNSNDVVTYTMNTNHQNNTDHSSLLFGQHPSSSSATSVIPKVIVDPMMKALDNLTLNQDTSRSNDIIILHDTDSEDLSTSADDIAFILIPLIIIMAVALFSGFALVCMQRRVKLDRLRHRLIPIYTFSPNEEDEWEVLTRPTSRHKNFSESSSE